jgi:hypothetical protein
MERQKAREESQRKLQRLDAGQDGKKAVEPR